MWGLKGPYSPRSTVEPHLLAAAAGTIFQCVCSFQLALAPVQGAQASKSGVDCGTVDRTGKSKNLYPTTSLHEVLGDQTSRIWPFLFIQPCGIPTGLSHPERTTLGPETWPGPRVLGHYHQDEKLGDPAVSEPSCLSAESLLGFGS